MSTPNNAMSASSPFDEQSIKSKPALQTTVPASHTPMTFFLRTGAELEKSMAEAEDSVVKEEEATSFLEKEDPAVASTASTAYGVQSLEDAMAISEDSLSASPRVTSHDPLISSSVLAGWKRKPGNPVHPKIYAAGQRIVSSDLHMSPTLSASLNSPSRVHGRRGSMSSSMHLTPPHISPDVDGALPGTPRTNSMKSFKLSDEEASIASDTGSQVLQSSSGEEENDMQLSALKANNPERESELVMPSIAMPARRPYTQRGRSIGQAKVMVAGSRGVGKSSLLRSIFRSCEDIVHVDGIMGSSAVQSQEGSKTSFSHTSQIIEFQASTKPYPLWWSDMENSRGWWRRKCLGDGVLERNLCFVDTPGIDGSAAVQALVKEVDTWYSKLADIDSLPEAQLFALLSGRTEHLLDVVLYLFDPNIEHISEDETRFLRELTTRTNLIPLLARSDTMDVEQAMSQKEHLFNLLVTAKIDFCSMSSILASDRSSRNSPSPRDIFAVSSLIDDGDVMDASTLMASDYLAPLAESELHNLATALFDPKSLSQLRHRSTIKFMTWRREHVARAVAQQPSLLSLPQSHIATSSGSLLDDPSKILVPPAYSSYYRSTSTSASDTSDILFGARPAANTQAEHILHAAEPSRHIHIAKWARDLRKSLRMDGSTQNGISTRPAKGRLGGELGIIDPKDPLGILSISQAFERNGWFALQIVSGCGLVGAAMWCMARNWMEIQEWIWPGNSIVTPIVVGVPSRSWMDNFRLL